MKLVNLQSKQVEDVPDEQVQAKFDARTHGFLKDQRVPVKAQDGTVGTVPAAEFHEATKNGATLISQEEYKQAEAEAKYGGVAGTLVAGAAGLARGATVGVSDPLAIGAAGLVGGKEAKEATRQYLAGAKEAHPYVSGATEIAGAALPIIASGGTAAPEVAAAEGAGEAAGGASAFSRLLSVVGAPAKGVSQLGRAAEAIAEPLAGVPGTSSALGRIAAAGVKAGASGLAEGAAFGAGNQLSEDVLGDHEMTAEKFVSAMGHGALYGLMLGGGVGTLGAATKEAAGAILSRIGPAFERQGRIEAARAMGVNKTVAKEASARAGGMEGLGETVQKYGLLGDNISDAARSTPEAVLERTKGAQDKVGSEIQGIVDTSGATVKKSEILGPLDKKIAELRETAIGKRISQQLESFRSDLNESLSKGAPQPVVEAAPRVARSGGEIADILRNDTEAAKEFATTGKLPDRVAFKGGLPPSALPNASDTTPISKLVEERRALGDWVYKQVKSLTPPEHIGELRDFYGNLMKLEEGALNKASEDIGGAEGTRLRALSKDYQRLKLIEKSNTDLVARQSANAHLSLTSKMFGAAHLAGALASGHPLAAVGAIGTSMATQAVQKHGSAVASMALGKLAKLDMLARASTSVDSDLAAAASKFVKGGREAPRIRLRHFGATPSETLDDRYEKAKARVENYPAIPATRLEQMDRVSPGMVQHAPKTSLAISNVVGNSAAFLASQVPKAPGAPSLLSSTPRPTQAQMASFVRKVDAVDDPVKTLTHMAETGKIHADQIQAIQATRPRVFAQFQQHVLKEVTEHRDKMTYEKVVALSKLTQQALDPSLQPDAVRYLQSTFMPTQQPGGAGPRPNGPKRMLKGFSESTALHAGHVDGGG